MHYVSEEQELNTLAPTGATKAASVSGGSLAKQKESEEPKQREQDTRLGHTYSVAGAQKTSPRRGLAGKATRDPGGEMDARPEEERARNTRARGRTRAAAAAARGVMMTRRSLGWGRRATTARRSVNRRYGGLRSVISAGTTLPRALLRRPPGARETGPVPVAVLRGAPGDPDAATSARDDSGGVTSCPSSRSPATGRSG